MLDKSMRMDFDRDIPNCRSLSPEQLAGEIGRRPTTPGPSG
jgi:hypothetical protein